VENHALPKKFIFNEKLDSEYLFSLYAEDYPYVEEIFATTLHHFDQDFAAIEVAWSTGSIVDLKRATHKIKPTFGYVGLPAVQELCKNFEEICQKVNTTDELRSDYKQIVITLAESKELIESEHRRLKEFNLNPL
jgi:HPt (histidine-containing phosphotransfer) domain-containing protein